MRAWFAPPPAILRMTAKSAYHLLAKPAGAAFFQHVDKPIRTMADLMRKGRYADEIMSLQSSGGPARHSALRRAVGESKQVRGAAMAGRGRNVIGWRTP